ncbi:MAG: WcaI family glycosyltransferase [Ferruginibacter sp.]
MSKRILFLGGNFSPEPTGIGKYSGEMIDFLAGKGFQCTVVTSFPYYPHWQVQEPYTKSSRWFKKELKTFPKQDNECIEIIRCPHYIPQKPTGLKRVISDFSFCFSAFIKIFQLLFRKRFDFVLVVAPPFQLGLLGILYKKIRGAKFIYHIQDLQIDAARDFKMIKSARVINVLLKIEKYILRNADVVSSISEGMIKKIADKFNREIVFFPNWVDTELFYPLPEKNRLKTEFHLEEDDKIVLYSGAIGEKQGLEAILAAGKAFAHHHNLKFVICGSGPYKKKLMELAENMQLNNIIFLGLQPFEKLNWFLNMADIHLVLQRGNATDLVMPSKLTTILSVGGVSIITAFEGSSLYDVISVSNMGILVEPENPQALIAAIDNALKNDNKIINQNARLYAEQYLSIGEIFRSFSHHLQ